MKVLTLKEPFGTLIKKGIKTIETRSWHTDYRGEIFIHTSQSKIKKEIYKRDIVSNCFNDDELLFGYIICKCNLVDCKKISDDFAYELKKNNKIEYACGNYDVGRYAWILKDIQPLDAPIKAKGKLYLWDYKKK